MNVENLEQVSYYHNSVQAWFLSSLTKDCLIAFFSIASIFAEMILGSNLVSRIGLTSSVFSVVVTVFIFGKNMECVEKIINGEERSSIGYLDKMNTAFFLISAICLVISFFGGLNV